MEITTRSPAETLKLGEELGKTLQPGDVVLLFGDLGAGKTALTQGICYGLGLPREEYIRSPTFTLINEYRGHCPIHHIDLYRLDTLAEIDMLGLEEILYGDGVSVVEWAEKLFPRQPAESRKGFPLEGRIEVTLHILDENRRRLDLQWVQMEQRPVPLFTLQ